MFSDAVLAMLTDKEWQVLLLRRKGLSQAEVARYLHTTQGAVSRFEANARAKILDAQDELARLARVDIKIERDEKPDERFLRDPPRRPDA